MPRLGTNGANGQTASVRAQILHEARVRAVLLWFEAKQLDGQLADRLSHFLAGPSAVGDDGWGQDYQFAGKLPDGAAVFGEFCSPRHRCQQSGQPNE